MRSRLSPSWSFVFHRSGLRRGRRLLCPLLTSPQYSTFVSKRPASSFRSTGEISRGKTRYLHCIDAGFTKCAPFADGGLRGHVPARPGCITPHIRFLFIAPQLRIGLPPDPASQRRPCPSPCLRLCVYLATGLSHLQSNAPCPAHTFEFSGGEAVRLERIVRIFAAHCWALASQSMHRLPSQWPQLKPLLLTH